MSDLLFCKSTANVFLSTICYVREFSRRFWAIRKTLCQNFWENSRLHNVFRIADLFLAIVKDILKNKCR